MSLENRKQCLELVNEAVVAGATQEAACGILELNTRTLQRWQTNPEQGDQRMGPNTASAKNLTEEEKKQMLKIPCGKKDVASKLLRIQGGERWFLHAKAEIFRRI